MITILMPVYNGIEFIDQSVSSILCQKYQNWELIIGINGYNENSIQYQNATKFKCDKIKVLDLFTINNKATALNKMIDYAKYDWISLLDVDDKWKPEKLLKQIKYLDNYDVIGTKCKYFGNKRNIPKIPVGDLKDFNFKQYNPIINSSCLIKKEYCWWDSTSPAEDYELWLRLKEQNCSFYNVPEILVLHRIHGKSFFNSTEKNNLF